MSFTVYKEQDMVGASSTTAGQRGLVPKPDAKKHTAFLRGDGEWVEPQYVKTVNGNAPDPSGNVDVSSGGSDSSVGILRLIKTIQPESWQAVSGGFRATVSDPKITSDMDVVEAWLTDEENAMLGTTTFTCSTGVLYITTETKPTVAWNLTVILGTNGAEAMDDLSALITKVGSATLQTESQNLSAAVNELDSTDNEIESGLAAISNGDTHAQLAAGQYVYIKGHSSIVEGLYKTTTAVDANGPLVGKVQSASDVLSQQSQQIDNLSAETVVSDCNAITATGVYKAINSTLNTPEMQNHYVIYHTTYNENEATQIAVRPYLNETYTRTKLNGVWTSWIKLASIAVREYTITVPAGYVAGANSVKIVDNIVTMQYRINTISINARQTVIVGNIKNGIPNTNKQVQVLLFDANGYPLTVGYCQIQTSGAISILGHATLDATGFILDASYTI